MSKKSKTPEEKLARSLRNQRRIKRKFDERLAESGMLEAFSYLYQIAPTKRFDNFFTDRPALATEYESFLRVRQSERSEREEVRSRQRLELAERIKQAEAKKQEELAEITLALNTARKFGTAEIYLASLPTYLRNQLGSREEKKSVAVMRKASINSIKARELLGCSISELNRWTQQGLTPILYTIASNYGIQRRYWAAETMAFAKDNMASWRAEHEALKAENRRVRSAQKKITKQGAYELAQQITHNIRRPPARPS